ncbi:hypothetical protein TIFTF001_007763 [Ficus carica]|uniref:Uncharacterized protein n=1 Tax=Ficus carica TaxID=3494 RepID=A0AA88D160_FICCA|nr:hypothetical protein TIFTF001_007763 [Ficus carica]
MFLFIPVPLTTRVDRDRKITTGDGVVLGVGVDEGEGNAGVLLDVGGAVTDVLLDGTVDDVLEAISAGLLVGQGGAHPRLDVAHLEPKRLAAAGPGAADVEMAHLPERASDLVDGVAEVGEAVVKGGGGAGIGAVVGLPGEVGHVGRHVLGLRQADRDGHARQLLRVPLHRYGVTGERREAELRVEGRAAACADEISAVGVGGGARVGVSYGWDWFDDEHEEGGEAE